MLTVITLLTLICGLAFGALIQAQVTVRGNMNRLDQAQQAKSAVESASKVLRTAVPPSLVHSGDPLKVAFVSAEWNKVVFYANLDNANDVRGLSKVTYALSAAGTLVETVQPPSGMSGGSYTYCTVGAVGCVASGRTLARKLVYSAAKPLFTYYSGSSGAELSAPLNSDDLNAVTSIDLAVSVRAGSEVAASTVLTRVSLTNINARNNNSKS